MPQRKLNNCSVASWYPNFASVSVKTKLISLPLALVARLVSGGVHLPAESPALIQQRQDEGDLSDWSESSDEEQCAAPSLAEQFPAIAEEISRAIHELGGQVIPKLNWSCPQDATWITATRSLKCANADEVLLLLSSSDRVAHDVEQATEAFGSDLQQSVPVHLALRKFQNFRPGREFRCFVRDNELVGICQRDITSHFTGLVEQQEELSEILLEFYEQHIELRFPDASYTFDTYVTTDGRVKLIDFNPIGFTTQPLLFTWQELGYGISSNVHATEDSGIAKDHEGLLFRVVEEENAIRPAGILYGAPYDFVEQPSGQVAESLISRVHFHSDSTADA